MINAALHPHSNDTCRVLTDNQFITLQMSFLLVYIVTVMKDVTSVWFLPNATITEYWRRVFTPTEHNASLIGSIEKITKNGLTVQTWWIIYFKFQWHLHFFSISFLSFSTHLLYVIKCLVLFLRRKFQDMRKASPILKDLLLPLLNFRSILLFRPRVSHHLATGHLCLFSSKVYNYNSS